MMVAAFVVAMYLFWLLRGTFINVFLAVLIGVALTIPTQAMEKRGVRRMVALLISTALMLAAFLILTLLIVPALVQQGTELVVSLGSSILALRDNYAALAASDTTVGAILPPLPSQIGEALDSSVAQADFLELARNLLSGAVAPVLQGIGLVAGLIFQLGFLLLLGIWFAIDPDPHLTGLLYLFPRGAQPRVVEVWDTLYHELSGWLKAQTISIGITMVLVYVLLGLLLGLPFALVVAVFAGVATFIPNIGAFLPIIPILIFGLASPTPERILIWLVVYLLIQLAESNFITPSVVKNQLDIPAGALLVFQLIATVIFGALGLLLAVPLFAVIIVLVRELYSYDTLGLRSGSVTIADVRESAGAEEEQSETAPAEPATRVVPIDSAAR